MVGRDRFGVLGSLLRWNHAHFNLDIDCDDEMKVQSEFFFFFSSWFYFKSKSAANLLEFGRGDFLYLSVAFACCWVP